jgi:hypothetical protein
MKIVQQTPTQLTLKKPNWSIWLQSVLFTGFGLFVIVQALYAGKSPGFGIMFFVAGLIGFFCSEISICDFNADTGQFTLKRQKLLGTKYIQHPLSEIVDIQVKSTSRVEATHKVVIVLSSGKHVPLSSLGYGDYEKIQKTETLIRNFLDRASARQS